MNSPHQTFLLLVLLVVLIALLAHRFHPRGFMKGVRLLDRMSGGFIIGLGLAVLICGLLGFANAGNQVPSTGQATPPQEPAASVSTPATLPTNQALTSQASPSGSETSSMKPTSKKSTTLAGAIYETFQIFAFNIDHTDLEESGWLKTAMIAAVLLATIVASKGIAILFHSSYEALGLRFKSNHVVVCGLGRIGRQVLADLEAMRSEFQIVVVEPDPDNKNIAWAREMGAVVLIGDATQSDTLAAAQVQRAREVFVVTGSDECNIETVIEIRDIVQRKGRTGLYGQQLPKLQCHVHILNKDLAEIVREKSLLLERTSGNKKDASDCPGQSDGIDIEVFNALERTARRLLEDIAATIHSKVAPREIDKQAAAEWPPQTLHYFLFGFGDFGQTLAMKLAELTHFPNSSRTRMTILDTKIAERAASFIARNPGFGPAIDPQRLWQFDPEADQWDSKLDRPGRYSQLPTGSPGIEYVCNSRFVEYRDIVDDEMLEQIFDCCKSERVQPVLLVCFEDDRENFARAERLRAKLNAKGKDWPIFVWIPRQRELSQLLSEHRSSMDAASNSQPTCHLIPFGQCYGSVSYLEIRDSWMDWLARHFHLVWMQPSDRLRTVEVDQFQKALKSKNGTAELAKLNWEEIDATAKKVWESMSEWERSSNRSCAVHAVLKAAVLGLKITGYSTKPAENPLPLTMTPQLDEHMRTMEHYRWVAERLLAGWKYDEERNNTRKTRWQITPWSLLDSPPAKEVAAKQAKGEVIDEKMKDHLIVQLVVQLLTIGLLTSEPLVARHR